MFKCTLDQAILILSAIKMTYNEGYSAVPDKHIELIRAREVQIEMSIIDGILNDHPQLEEDFSFIIGEIRKYFNQVK